MEESQGETAQAHFSEQMREYHPNNGEDRSLHERMAELLWDSGHEEQHRKPEWMAVPPDTDVYLEAVETAKDTQTEADRIRAAGVGGLRRSIQPKSLLENGGKRSRAKSTNERKTDKLGLL